MDEKRDFGNENKTEGIVSASEILQTEKCSVPDCMAMNGKLDEILQILRTNQGKLKRSKSSTQTNGSHVPVRSSSSDSKAQNRSSCQTEMQDLDMPASPPSIIVNERYCSGGFGSHSPLPLTAKLPNGLHISVDDSSCTLNQLVSVEDVNVVKNTPIQSSSGRQSKHELVRVAFDSFFEYRMRLNTLVQIRARGCN